MDNSTYFIENKALFGSYPTNEDVKYFESIGVKYFVDLTEIDKLPPYELSINSVFIKYPIPDMKIPTNNLQFCSFLVYLENIIRKNDGYKMYIHCRGGNGRAGIVVACLLARYQSLTALDALQLTLKYHSERKNLKLKWKLIGAPQTIWQKNFVIKIFTPFCFYKDVLFGNKYGFVPYSKIPIVINNTIYHDSQSAYKSLIQDMPFASQDDIYNCMKYVQTLKIQQCPILLENLLHTNLRPILYCNSHDKFWGIDKIGNGNNYLGKILSELRDEILLENYNEIKK